MAGRCTTPSHFTLHTSTIFFLPISPMIRDTVSFLIPWNPLQIALRRSRPPLLAEEERERERERGLASRPFVRDLYITCYISVSSLGQMPSYVMQCHWHARLAGSLRQRAQDGIQFAISNRSLSYGASWYNKVGCNFFFVWLLAVG